MKEAMRKFISFLISAIILYPGLIPQAFGQQQNQQKITVKTALGDGFSQSAFEFPGGAGIYVRLPNEIRAGDTISGTVISEPRGRDELQGSVIEIENTAAKSPLSEKILKFSVPAMASGGEIALILKDRSGKALARAPIPISASIPDAGSDMARASGFQLPQLGQAGRPITIPGPFDGDLGTTIANIGGHPAEAIAESPRECVFSSPLNAIGESQIEILEQNAYASGPYRNIGVKLSSEKLTLRKGETTEILIALEGLNNLQSPIEVGLQCSGSANMEGGNQQALRIRPEDVSPDGTAINRKTLSGVMAGGFFVTANVFAKPAQENPCPLKDKTIHVEGTPGGGNGLWILPVTLPDGKRGNIFIKSEKKPNLKFCDWIKIKDCTTSNGTTTISDYEKTENPNKKPPTKPAEPPKPAEPRKPTAPTGGGETTTTEKPCKNGETRNLKKETKEFEIMTADSKIDLSATKSTDGAIDAAIGLSEFFKTAKKIGDLVTDRLPEGSTVAGWVLGYLDRGSEILDAVAKSSLKNTAKEINISLGIGTKKITATCTSFEVCINGKWVPKKMLEKSERDSSYKKSLKISYGDDNWFKIAQDSKPQMFDPAKLDQFVKDWLKEQINILKSGEEAYNEFLKNCK